MLEVYSVNVTVPAGSAFPLNTVKILKGCTATIGGNSIQLNRAGVYNVSVSASLEPGTAGDVSLALYKDGSPVAGASTSFTGALNTVNTASLDALIQCPQNNNPCNCSTSPLTITIVNTGETEVTGNINVVVTKLC